MYNIANVEAAQGVSLTSNLLGIADAVNSLIDDILVSYASAQLMITKDRIISEVQLSEAAIVIGTPAYIFPIFALNLLICFIYFFEVLRTRGWRHLTSFNFMDVKTVIIGTSMGGTAVANKALTIHDAQGSVWLTDGNDRAAGRIRIQLAKSSKDAVAVVIADDENPVYPQARHSTPEVPKTSDTEILLRDFGSERA